MPTTEESIRNALARVGQEIEQLAWSVGRDAKTEKRKRIMWGALQGALGAAATIGARRGVAKLWGVLTGERPPTRK